MDPMRSHPNNLQKIETDVLVKDNIVLTIPNCLKKAEIPLWVLDFVSLSISFSQLPNILVIFKGGGILSLK
jgi:hypothetical protein